MKFTNTKLKKLLAITGVMMLFTVPVSALEEEHEIIPNLLRGSFVDNGYNVNTDVKKLMNNEKFATYSSCSAIHGTTGGYKEHYTRAQSFKAGINIADTGRVSTKGFFIDAQTSYQTYSNMTSHSKGFWGWGK